MFRCSVWDWTHKKRLRLFRNGNPKGTSITSLQIINQNVGGIITTGSGKCYNDTSMTTDFPISFYVADGIVRLYRNYDPLVDTGSVQMVSSFRGLNEIVPMRHGSGVVMDWKQSAGILLVGGDSKVIKTWDAQTEMQGLVCLLQGWVLFIAHSSLGSGYCVRCTCNFNCIRPRLHTNLCCRIR